MKAMKVLVLIFLSLSLTACLTPMSETIMPTVTYEQPIEWQQPNKNLYLTWHKGKVIGAKIERQQTNSVQSDNILAGLLAAAIVSAAEQKEQTDNSNAYILKYGPAQQAIFITSLRDVLFNNESFSAVNITAEPPEKLTANDLILDIRFNKTTVKNASGVIPIDLEVTLTLTSAQGKPYIKHLQVKSEESFWKNFVGRSFIASQTEISKQLMDEVVLTLDGWAEKIA